MCIRESRADKTECILLSMGADVQFGGLVGTFVHESAFHSELMAGGIFCKRWVASKLMT